MNELCDVHAPSTPVQDDVQMVHHPSEAEATTTTTTEVTLETVIETHTLSSYFFKIKRKQKMLFLFIFFSSVFPMSLYTHFILSIFG